MNPLFKWLRQLKSWVENFANRPGATWALFSIAFAESSFFPVPPDVLLIALAVLVPERSLRYALVCSIGSILGGMFGYLIGYGLYESIGQHIIDFYRAGEYWERVRSAYQGEIGVWFLALAAFTPIPYKVATIAAGATEMPFSAFVIISSIGRSARFFLVGGLIYLFGPKVKTFIDRYFEVLSIVFFVLLILGILAISHIL
ncbi:MAG: YqaA family protein [Bacteroidota bacterium]